MKTINQKPLAEDVSSKIKYNFFEYFLVKPLDPVKVKKEFSTPVPIEKKPKSDKNGIEATDYNEVKKEIKEVDSDYRTGIVLKVPYKYTQWMQHKDDYDVAPVEVGDTVFYNARHAAYFDLVKDSQIVRPYDIMGVVND